MKKTDLKSDLIYGVHTLKQILQTKPQKVLTLYVQEANMAFDEQLKPFIETFSINVQFVSKKKLDEWLPNTNHQGVAAKVKKEALLTQNDLADLVQNSQKPPLFLVLDGVQDPHNLGACLRTADAVGVTAVIIPKDRSVGITPVVHKVACGALETVPVVEVTNLVRALESLKSLGVWVMGAVMDEGSQPFYKIDLKGSVAIVLGAEGTGLRRLTLDACDLFMHIPMQGVVESLNVSVAAGVILYEALRQRMG